MSEANELSPGRRRVAETLKTEGPLTAAELAMHLELTDVAVRQHLVALESVGFVGSETLPASGPGRPSRRWSLTPAAMGLFPDRHGELTVGLIEAIRGVVGEQGLDAIIDARGEAQKRQYEALMPEASAGLAARVDALAAQRTREGYMALVQSESPEEMVLVERHCPICEAATTCMSLCRVELDVFRHALGPDVSVEREKHLLDGDDRCAYRIRRR